MGAATIFFGVIAFSVLAFTSQIKAKQVVGNQADINTDVSEEKNVSLEKNAKEDVPTVHVEENIDEPTKCELKTKLDPTEDKQILKRSSDKSADDAADLAVNLKNSPKNKDKSKSSEILSETDIAKKSVNVLANDNKADTLSDKKEIKTATLLDETSEYDKEEEIIAHSDTTPGADLKEDSDSIDTHLKGDTPLLDNKDESKVEEESDPVNLASADFFQSRRTLSAVHPEIVERKAESDVVKTPGTVGAVFHSPGVVFRNLNGFNNDLGSKRSYPNEINTPRLLFEPAASIMYEFHHPVHNPAPLLNRFTAADVVNTTPFINRFSTTDVVNSWPLLNKFSSSEVINSTPRNTKRFPIQEPVNPAPILNKFAVQEVTNPTLLYNRFPVQEITNPRLMFNKFAIPEGINSNSFHQRYPSEYSESRQQNQRSESTTNSYPFSPTTTQNLDVSQSPFDIFSKLAKASESTGPQNYHENFYKPFEPNYNIHNYNLFIS